MFQLLLVLDTAFEQAGLIEALHDEIGAMLVWVEMESFVLDDGRMAELFQVNEISLKLQYMFFLDLQLLGRIGPSRCLVQAFVNAGIRAFS